MSKSDCTDLTAKTKATLYPREKHRDNGYKHISTNGERIERYNGNNDRIKAGLLELDIKPASGHGEIPQHERYYFAYMGNFKNGSTPYHNQAHHLLPAEFWDKMSLEQMKILSQIDYHIDNGENIIFLPREEEGQPIHRLPIHNGSHADYNEAVIEDADKIKKDIDKAVEKSKECKSNKPSDSITENLMALQNDYWNLISESDEKHVNQVDITDMSDL